MSTTKDTSKKEGPKTKEKTHYGTSISLAKYFRDGSLDEALTDMCIKNTIGEIVHKREVTCSARGYFLSDLIFSAVFERDMTTTYQIINRIDGTTPAAEGLDQYANFTGMALQDVLELKAAEQMKILPDDPVIIALAKTIYCTAVSHPKKGGNARKEKNMAIEIIFNRVGGRKTEPTRLAPTIKYTEPAWLNQLEKGEEDLSEG